MQDRSIKMGLTSLGILGLLVGIAIILCGVFYLPPKVSVITTAIDRDLTFLQNNLDTLSRNTLFTESVLNTSKTFADLSNLFPATAISINGTLLQSANALETMGSTLDALENGITGIVLPKTKLGKNILSLEKVADQLRLLASMTQKMAPVLSSLSQDSSNASKGIRQLRNNFPSMKLFTSELSQQIRSLRNNLDPSLLSAPISIGVIFCGGIYCLLGLLFFAISTIYSKLERLSVPVQNVQTFPNKSEKAA